MDKKGPTFENDIFSIAAKHMEETKGDKPTEKTAIFVGEKESGKSTLINALTGDEISRDYVPTAGMSYKFSHKKIDARKVVGNFHEIGGGRLMSDLLATQISSKKIADIVLVIWVDMDKPDTALHHLNYWLSLSSTCVNKAIEELENTTSGASTPVLQANASKWSGHVDNKRVSPIPVPVIIACTKYDKFSLQEPEKAKWMWRALRYFAHMNGCDLAFWNYKEVEGVKALVNKHVYGANKEPKAQTEHTRAILVQEGQDKLTAIGEPENLGGLALDQAWINNVQKHFPLTNQIEEVQTDDKDIDEAGKYAEQKVDAMKSQKEQELERSLQQEQAPKKKRVLKVKKAAVK